MFREPPFFGALRERVVPLLRTHPFVRVWIAGCSTGEEGYSLAVPLEEAGLRERTRVYATDIDELVLERARSGVFPLAKMREYTGNSLAAGGTAEFSSWYVTGYDGARFARGPVDNVVFAQHNLVSDRAVNEFHLSLCRNVMIYFDRALRARVHRLFHDSLGRFGVLGLGRRESIRPGPVAHLYDDREPAQKLYRKASAPWPASSS